ncbi:hypothetical protein ABZN20_16185 [Methylococcus sp. ANG]|uniref:hypothetical protein n=1 Tax=Methylococcus sp. ANG TaxID=3231903 RepID=UPI00345A4191
MTATLHRQIPAVSLPAVQRRLWRRSCTSMASIKHRPSGYLQQLRAEFEVLSRQLSEAERAATAAQTEAEHKRRAYRELEERSPSTT